MPGETAMKRHAIRSFAALGIIAGALSFAAAAETPDAALKAAIADTARPAADVARDRYRHPAETLAFWGLKPGLNVLEIDAGTGYWTWILARYAKMSGGHYAANTPDFNDPRMTDQGRKFWAGFKARYAAEDKYGKVGWVVWNDAKDRGLDAPAGSFDMVITARNIHDWMWTPGELEKALKDFHTALKPGGILAVEEHRADPRKQVVDAHDGYVNTDYLVKAVEKAGFKLEASSEINANPKDTKDYAGGVWTLPPTYGEGDKDKAKYQAIGESDRMTLRFRKPKS